MRSVPSGPGLDAERIAELEHALDALPTLARAQTERRNALSAFSARGFPTRREEAWKYTDLKLLAEGTFDFTPAPTEATPDARDIARELLTEAGSQDSDLRAVFIDGQLDQDLSVLEAPAGLELASLMDAPASIEDRGHGYAGTEGHALASLNTAFAVDGLTIRTAARSELAEPVHLYFIGIESGVAVQPRINIALAAHSSLGVVVHSLDVGASATTRASGEAAPSRATDSAQAGNTGHQPIDIETSPASWLNVVTQVSLGDGARLSIHRLQEHGSRYFETSLLAASVGKDAMLEVGYVDLGGRLVRNDIDIRLSEPGAEVTLFGVFVAGTDRHIDNHTLIDHAAPHTTSNEIFRGIADAGGHGVFNGKVIVRPDAQKIVAHQTSNNLLLADRAEIDTSPMLEIYADDVKCSHGATVGELDENHLFYLRSRGIDEEVARGLLTFAFAASVLERLPEPLRSRAITSVAGQLPGEEIPVLPEAAA